MSIAQIEKIADRLSPQERAYLRAYLMALERIENGPFKMDIARRRREMNSGLYVTSAQVKRLHRRLETKGL